MFDVRTPNLDLPLPDHRNPLKFDVNRLIQSLTKIDEVMSGFGGILNGMTGVMLDYSLSTLPDDSWRFCDGAALLEGDEKAAKLRQKLIDDGSPYGADPDGNPRLPDARGRATAGKDDMGGAAAGRLTATAIGGVNGTVLGGTGGAETVTLNATQIPSHSHGVTDTGHGHGVNDPGHAHSVYDPGHSHGYYLGRALDSGTTQEIRTLVAARQLTTVAPTGVRLLRQERVSASMVLPLASAFRLACLGSPSGIQVKARHTATFSRRWSSTRSSSCRKTIQAIGS